MGGGGGYGFSRRSGGTWPAANLSQSLEATRQKEQEVELAQVFDETVADINQVDMDALNTHKDEILNALRNNFPDAEDLRGGGSYTKHTYVNGLSDVDVLLDLGPYSQSDIPNKDNPQEVLKEMERRLQQRFPRTDVHAGRMAVTVRFSDGLEIQVLPAFSYYSGYRIPNPQGQGWVETRPKVFAKLLRDRNQEVGGKLLRCIKLAKVICEKKGVDVKSYHLENLAIKAFERYVGPKSDREMLRHLFNKAKESVTQPMQDVTGQQAYVDSYLTDRAARVQMARQLAGIEQEVANAATDPSAWRKILKR